MLRGRARLASILRVSLLGFSASVPVLHAHGVLKELGAPVNTTLERVRARLVDFVTEPEREGQAPKPASRQSGPARSPSSGNR